LKTKQLIEKEWQKPKSEPNDRQVQHVLLKVNIYNHSHFKFIEHNQPEEFIEVFKMHKKANGGNIDDMLEEFGKTYLHLAVEHQSRRIVEFLMFE
jgi:hypothetical protein